MSQREFAIVLAHTHLCGACRARLLADSNVVVAARPLSAEEKDALGRLEFEDFITPAALSRAAGIGLAELNAYLDEPVVRLRHL